MSLDQSLLLPMDEFLVRLWQVLLLVMGCFERNRSVR